jgi:hypothetical protein
MLDASVHHSSHSPRSSNIRRTDRLPPTSNMTDRLGKKTNLREKPLTSSGEGKRNSANDPPPIVVVECIIHETRADLVRRWRSRVSTPMLHVVADWKWIRPLPSTPSFLFLFLHHRLHLLYLPSPRYSLLPFDSHSPLCFDILSSHIGICRRDQHRSWNRDFGVSIGIAPSTPTSYPKHARP